MSDHPLLARARTSRVPVAALIGLSTEPLGDGQAACEVADAESKNIEV